MEGKRALSHEDGWCLAKFILDIGDLILGERSMASCCGRQIR